MDVSGRKLAGRDEGLTFAATPTLAYGPWTKKESDGFVSTDVLFDEGAQPYVLYKPSVTLHGNYTVSLYTPGCKVDDSCSNRGSVNITMDMLNSFGLSVAEIDAAPAKGTAAQVIINQTSPFSRWTDIYEGLVHRTSDDFQSVIMLKPADDYPRPFRAVAGKVLFRYKDTSSVYGTTSASPPTSVSTEPPRATTTTVVGHSHENLPHESTVGLGIGLSVVGALAVTVIGIFVRRRRRNHQTLKATEKKEAQDLWTNKAELHAEGYHVEADANDVHEMPPEDGPQAHELEQPDVLYEANGTPVYHEIDSTAVIAEAPTQHMSA